MYIWQQSKWPLFTWDKKHLSKSLMLAHREQGRLFGKMEALGFNLRDEAYLRTLTNDVVKSSEIEGEKLDSSQVKSSIARRLGMDVAGLVPADRNVEGIVEMMLDATSNYNEPLTKARLFDWHAALFPTGRSGMNRIIVGNWRDDSEGPMQVVSGPIGREKIHYIAPPATELSNEMKSFISWFEDKADNDPLINAGLAHLWFVTIHPFDDGNGRIARAIADMALAKSENSNLRFYSMSSQIRLECEQYYTMLEHTQKSDLDVTNWLEWFLECLIRAVDNAKETLDSVLIKSRFWERFTQEALNERQIKILNLLLDDFEGNLTSSKWAKIAKCSQDTAHRDILNLIELGALQKDPGGGRSTSYSLIIE